MLIIIRFRPLIRNHAGQNRQRENMKGEDEKKDRKMETKKNIEREGRKK
jgi:hypothetical protein